MCAVDVGTRVVQRFAQESHRVFTAGRSEQLSSTAGPVVRSGEKETPLGRVLGQLSNPVSQRWGFFLKPGLEDTCCMSPGARNYDRGKLNPSFVHWPAGVSFEVSEATRARRIVPEIEL